MGTADDMVASSVCSDDLFTFDHRRNLLDALSRTGCSSSADHGFVSSAGWLTESAEFEPSGLRRLSVAGAPATADASSASFVWNTADQSKLDDIGDDDDRALIARQIFDVGMAARFERQTPESDRSAMRKRGMSESAAGDFGPPWACRRRHYSGASVSEYDYRESLVSKVCHFGAKS